MILDTILDTLATCFWFLFIGFLAAVVFLLFMMSGCSNTSADFVHISIGDYITILYDCQFVQEQLL